MSHVGLYNLTLTTVENTLVQDDDVWVRFFEVMRPSRDISSVRNLAFPPEQSFELPAYPQASDLICEVNASGFRSARSGAFTLNDGETKPVTRKLFRKPNAWKAEFVPWDNLGEEFTRLTEVLDSSPNIYQIKGPQIGYLTGQTYDGLTTDSGVLAKTCLLNLYLTLGKVIEPVNNEQPWFHFVKRILAFGRERFIAIVDQEMADLIRHIKSNISSYELYKHTPAENHHPNIPPGYRVRKGDMFSVKTREDHGNLQLTIAPGTAPDGTSVAILDADIDENGKLLAHLADLFKHQVNGGTHPYGIHEFLKIRYPGERLGYSLLRI